MERAGELLKSLFRRHKSGTEKIMTEVVLCGPDGKRLDPNQTLNTVRKGHVGGTQRPILPDGLNEEV